MVDMPMKPTWKTCPECGGDKHFNAKRCRACRWAANQGTRYRETTHPETGERIYEHRLIAEQMLGRRLAHEEHVHHINGDKRDNRPENLEVLSREAHARRHGAKIVCAHEGTPENTYLRPDNGYRVCRLCAREKSSYRAWKRKVARHARGLKRQRSPLEAFSGQKG